MSFVLQKYPDWTYIKIWICVTCSLMAGNSVVLLDLTLLGFLGGWFHLHSSTSQKIKSATVVTPGSIHIWSSRFWKEQCKNNQNTTWKQQRYNNDIPTHRHLKSLSNSPGSVSDKCHDACKLNSMREGTHYEFNFHYLFTWSTYMIQYISIFHTQIHI